MINNLIEKLIGFTKQHNPEIVVGLGVAGMITSTALAVKATPKAMQLIEDKKSELGVTYLTRKEIAEATWKQYIPAVGVGAVSIACIVLGTTKNIKRNTALATVYAISENTLKEYKAKIRSFNNVDDRLMSIDIDDLSRILTLVRYKWNPEYSEEINGLLNGVQKCVDSKLRGLLEEQRVEDVNLWKTHFSKYLPEDE